MAGEPLCDLETPLLRPKTLSKDRLMKKLLVTHSYCYIVWTQGAYDAVTESVHVSCVVHSGFVSQKLFQVAVSCLYHTSDPLRNVCKCCVNLSDTSMGVSPCKWGLGRKS